MIQRLYVHNLRCLENFELPIAAKSSSLLIGRNGSGKSTVRFALEVLQSIARGVNRVSQLLKPGDFTRGRSEIPLRLELEAMVGNAAYQYVLVLELPSGMKEGRVREERLAVDGRAIYSRNQAAVALHNTLDDIEPRLLIDWQLVALPIIQEHSEADPLALFRNWLARMLILSPVPSLISGDSDGETLTPSQGMEDFGAWFSGILAYSPAAYNAIDGYLKHVMNDFSDVKNPTIGRDFRSLTVRFRNEQGVLSLPFRALSDGEKCMFICAAVLAANEVYGPLVCLWDEPDNYLSISEVGDFVMALRRSFETGGQLIVCSHNPQAIRQFSDENTFFLHRHSHLEPALIRSVSEMRRNNQLNGSLVDALIRNDVEL